MQSVNTNYGALVALQSLNQTTKELSQVQSRVNTGLKVGSAKDDGAVYAIAQGQRARVGALEATTSGIDRATSTIDVALGRQRSRTCRSN
jgi:flagellin